MTPPPPRQGAWALPVLMLAAFAAATGYGIALPRLPGLLEALPGAGGAAWLARHVGGLTATYFASALLAAPLWGRLSDQFGRRIILAIGAGGFAIGLVATELAGSLGGLYIARGLDGGFTAAVAPTALAYLADRWPAPDARARRFAWLNASVLAGYLAGPLTGEGLAVLGDLAPVAGPAALALAAAAAMIVLERDPSPRSAQAPRRRGQLSARTYLLALSAVAVGAVVAQELAVMPLGGAGGRTSAALLLSFCGGVMFLTEVVIFAGRNAAARATGLRRPLLILLALVLAASPLLAGFWLQALAISAVASAAAALNVLASYLTSRLQSGGQGAGLGLQAAAASGGQLIAALAAGLSQSVGSPIALWGAAILALGLALIPAGRTARERD